MPTKFLNLSTDTTLGGAAPSDELAVSQRAIKLYVDSQSGGGGESLAAGFISTFAGSTVPSGWLACDGSAISRTDYADLFAAIGTTYGSGDGSTTFNLPIKYVYTGRVAGNGMTIGLETNSGNAGVILLGSGAPGNVGSYLRGATNVYGTNVGTTGNYSTLAGTDNTSVGFTQDASKTGLECEIATNGIVCIKY